jgi:hypothetical protein
MSILEEVTGSLRSIESELLARDREDGVDATRIAERIHRVVELLSSEDAQWVGTTEAKRLFGISSENTVKAWARLGLLRSRTLPNGRVQVLLDDVLFRRAERDALEAIGGEDLSAEELRSLRESRPGRNPWKCAPTDQRQ